MKKQELKISDIGRPRKELPPGHISPWTPRDADKVRVILERSRAKYPGPLDCGPVVGWKLNGKIFPLSANHELTEKELKSLAPVFGRPQVRLSDETLALVLEFFGCPSVIDATGKPKNRSSRMMLQAKTIKAIRFAKLFADAPEAMIEAFGKIRKLLKSLARKPRNTVRWQIAIERELHLLHGWPDFDNNRKASEIAGDLKKFNKGITARTIDHARDDVRTFARKK
jgi:hypothetical protein